MFLYRSRVLGDDLLSRGRRRVLQDRAAVFVGPDEFSLGLPFKQRSVFGLGDLNSIGWDVVAVDFGRVKAPSSCGL